MWIHIKTTLYEPSQYMRWNTRGDFFGGGVQKKGKDSEESALKTQKCKAHPMVRYETARLIHTVAFWMHDCADLPQVQIENPCTLSRLSCAETLAHQRGFKCSRWKHRIMKEGTRSRFLQVLPLTYWKKKTWNVTLVTLWCIVMGKILLFCLYRKKNNAKGRKSFQVRNVVLLLYYYKYFIIKCTLFYRLTKDCYHWRQKVYHVILCR